MKPSVAFVILMCLCEAVAVPRALSGNVKDVFRLEKRQQDTGTSDAPSSQAASSAAASSDTG